MPTTLTFAHIQSYLDAILTKASGDITVSPHGRFWREKLDGSPITYQEFVDGVVPGADDPNSSTACAGTPVPNINKASPSETAFYEILKGRICDGSLPRMPKGGTFVFAKDANGNVTSTPTYDVSLPDGSVVQMTGVQIMDNIGEWLANGFPE